MTCCYQDSLKFKISPSSTYFMTTKFNCHSCSDSSGLYDAVAVVPDTGHLDGIILLIPDICQSN